MTLKALLLAWEFGSTVGVAIAGAIVTVATILSWGYVIGYLILWIFRRR